MNRLQDFKTTKKEKRQLASLLNSLLQRRGGPKLLQSLLKRRKAPIILNNNEAQKPIEIFGQNPPVGVGRGEPRTNDINPIESLLNMNSKPSGFGGAFNPSNPDGPARPNTFITQPNQTPVNRQEDSSNIQPFLQNQDVQNVIGQEQPQPTAQQQLQGGERRMFSQPVEQMTPTIPPQLLDQPTIQPNPEFIQGPQPNPEILSRPLIQANPEFVQPPTMRSNPEVIQQQFPGFLQQVPPRPELFQRPGLFQPLPLQPNPFGGRMPAVNPIAMRMFPIMPQIPPMYPMMPQVPPPPGGAPFLPFMFPPMQPMGPYGGPTNNDEDRPSVKVNVQTSRSRIQKSKNTKKS